MVFSCPICSERLDRVPGGQNVAKTQEDINISSTPCGHIFHTFCIQKWLTGALSNANKQCPCCRKVVPGAKTLPLFPDRYDTSLDDSFVGAGGSGGLSCDGDHSHYQTQLSSLKQITENLREKITETEELLQVQNDVSEDYKTKFTKEKERSNTYLIQWKQAESYKSYAEQQERECTNLTETLKQYELISIMVQNVKEDVKYDLQRYASTSSFEKLLEIHYVIKEEYDTATKKLTEAQTKQENDRQEISRLRKKYNDLQKAHAELERVHFNCSDNGNVSFATGTTPQSLNKIDHHVMKNNSRTPLTLPNSPSKFNRAMLGRSSKLLDEVDTDIPMIQPFNKKSKKLVQNIGVDDNTKNRLKPEPMKQSSSKPSTVLDKKLKRTFDSSSDNKLPSKTKNFSLFPDFEDSIDTKSATKPSSSKKSKQDHNDTIELDDSDDELLDIPLRGSLPGLKIEQRRTAMKPKQFTFKKKP